tara:strand:- start:4183 stop:4728 length:546 start_codon:yes stop_codon:yes gene_type:complete
MNIISFIFHTAAYYASWLLCLYLAANGAGTTGAGIVLAITITQLGWQYYHRLHTDGLMRFIVGFVMLGSCVDTLLLWSGFITFASNPFFSYFSPPWMISLWLSFGVSLFATLHHLFKSWILMGLLAFFGFMMAYALGTKMGAASLPHGYVGILIVGVIWAFLFPLYLYHYPTFLCLANKKA